MQILLVVTGQPMAKLIGALGVLVATSAIVAACGSEPSPSVPAVDSADLQVDIAKQLAAAGENPMSVTCPAGLVGEVGQVARCDVVMGPTNSFQPIVTVTEVDGATIAYEMKPALSREQLEGAVARLLEGVADKQVTSVECLSDLVGELGAVARCVVTADGVTLSRTAEVTQVDGLLMNFDLVPMLTRTELEASLLDNLAVQLGGERPDSATCGDHLEGRPGNTVDCTVVADGISATLRLTVTDADGAEIHYSYARLPGE